jgi:RimJ/RimL family protein N-acetyltransferase
MKFTLRAFRYGDEESIAFYANNSKIAQNVRDSFPNPYTIDDATWWVSFNQTIAPPLASLAIDVDGQVIGGIGIIVGTDVHRCSAEIGYWLGEPYWGMGIMTEAVRQMVTYTFTHFQEIERIYAGVFDYNKASMKVLEKAGFTLESIQKKAIIKNGLVFDSWVFVQLRQ